MIGRLPDRLRGVIPEIRLPELGRRVEIPVHVIHNTTDPEDYFFIFDFEQFVERSRAGVFARPVVKIWAGRSDFDRRAFARQFRQAFARDFDAARATLDAESRKRGWFGWLPAPTDLVGLASTLATNVVLLIALSAGRAVFGQLSLPGWLRRRGERERLEAAIADTQGHVDAALERVEIVLHMDLYRHAWRGARGGRLTGMDYDAWPLPASVAQYLDIEGPECSPRS
ncbi:MAG: hypothetical protein AAF919_01565 [Pseudomonadota bacterium]